MSDECGNCGAAIRKESAFKAANDRFAPKGVALVNFITNASFAELCDKCGDQPLRETYGAIDREIEERRNYLANRVTDFPMFTVSSLPSHAQLKLKNLITANVTVGTGIFSEFSQGLSDLFGAVNTDTGMSFKVNKGEATARSILVTKALAVGANCVIGVDIDYGTTGNNAATINMQGTAARISNLDQILDEPELARAAAFNDAQARIVELRRLRKGDIPSGPA